MYIAPQQMAPVRRLSGVLGQSGKSSQLGYIYKYIYIYKFIFINSNIFWKFFALSEGTKCWPIFKFCVFAALTSLTSLTF